MKFQIILTLLIRLFCRCWVFPLGKCRWQASRSQPRLHRSLEKHHSAEQAARLKRSANQDWNYCFEHISFESKIWILLIKKILLSDMKLCKCYLDPLWCCCEEARWSLESQSLKLNITDKREKNKIHIKTMSYLNTDLEIHLQAAEIHIQKLQQRP